MTDIKRTSSHTQQNIMICMLYLTLLVVSLSAGNALPEEHLDVPGIVRYWGYPVETHTALTQDGYFLTLHRIPRGNPGTDTFYNQKKDRPVTFLQHGLLCSSSNWVINPPRESLGFMLADAGFDVWMGNIRGNVYSRQHLTHTTNSTNFWDFSFDEMAKYDLPAMINYVLNTSGKQSLYYIGHSQGTMMAFAGLSESKTLQSKIKMVFALAPVARLGHTESPIKYLSYFQSGFSSMFNLLGIKEFLPSDSWMNYVAEKVCPYGESLCGNVLFLIAGFDRKNLNETRESVYLAHTPAGTSVKDMLHFCQLIRANRFEKYDYGYLQNLLRYGTYYPPSYDLKSVLNRVVLISGNNDWLADPTDVKWLSNELPHVIKTQVVAGYNHLDFIWGMKARNKIYKKMIKMMRKYDDKESNANTTLEKMAQRH